MKKYCVIIHWQKKDKEKYIKNILEKEALK